MTRTDWDKNTDIEAVFDLVLNTAIENHLSQAQLPKKIYIISDMGFDSAVDGKNDIALFRNIRNRFESVGYEMPILVFWNVNANPDNGSPMTVDDSGVVFVSGASPSVLKSLLGGKIMDAVNVMMDTIHSERYQAITV